MEEIKIAKPDLRSGVVVYERWTPEWIEAYTLDSQGQKKILHLTRNTYGIVPWIKIPPLPEILENVSTEPPKDGDAGSAEDRR